MTSNPLAFATLGALALLFSACTAQDDPQEIRRQNETAQFIARNQDDQFAATTSPIRKPIPPYEWRESTFGKYSKITKEYFRCYGSSLNPANIMETPDGKIFRIADCSGGHHHSLPLADGQERIYPALLELLNAIQDQTGHRVAITCGHRCPLHNTYADDSKYNATSKHMIGAEVDFYVQGMEDQPEKILNIVLDYYKEKYPDSEALNTFERYTKPDTNVSTPPWYNKEVFVKLFKAEEGRDLDNRHPYPYVSIQIRWDRETDKRVTYTWNQAHRGYLKS